MDESQRVLKYFEDNKRLVAKYNHYLFFPERERIRLKELAKSMFEFGYNNYIAHAWPFDGSLNSLQNVFPKNTHFTKRLKILLELDPIYYKGREKSQLHAKGF